LLEIRFMKLLLLFLFISFYSYNQSNPNSNKEEQIISPPFVCYGVCDNPDQEAAFPCVYFYASEKDRIKGKSKMYCGLIGMNKWISENINYPNEALEKNEQGTVYISFTVGKDGNISGLKVDKGVSPALNMEAHRVVRKMPKWIPGKAEGKLVCVKCHLPITFKIQ